MKLLNTIAEEVEKTKTRIATSQHYQSGDIYTQWQPSQNMYDVKTLSVGRMQDYFTLLPGDNIIIRNPIIVDINPNKWALLIIFLS